VSAPAYSIVVPAYNEGERLGASLEQMIQFLAERGWDAEILVVNDGSTDNTAAVADRYRKLHPAIRLIENPGNRGKGYSVRNGIRHARGEWLFFTDADLSAPIYEAAKLAAAIQSGADIAIGSRWVRPELMTERQPPYRQFFGRIFNLLLRLVLGLKFKDTQCGLKAFTRRAAQAVFSRQRIERWGFDPELLFLAERLGLRTVEVPVQWANDARSKVRPLVDGIQMFGELLRIRWYAVSGRYAAPGDEKLEQTPQEQNTSPK
jgi:glycosyltransferase involved in cell wall biosynthesis